LYGRGACDTKGSGAAMFWALQAYAKAERRPHNVGLLFALDEEARMTGAKAFAAVELKEFLPKLRGVIVGEPTLMRPVVATNGVIRWKTITRGRAAHSSVPANGQSAISAMLRVVEALESNYVPTVTGSHPLTGRAAMSVNVIRGGTQVNIIPEYCEIECDRRTVRGLRDPAAAIASDTAAPEATPLRRRIDPPPLDCPEPRRLRMLRNIAVAASRAARDAGAFEA
ncbi:MAG: M20/M25/M40 family metallo-hydrolase, partial [Phycisphaerales bacterium]